MAHHVIYKHRHHDDGDTYTYMVCVETEEGRAHAEFEISGYDDEGDPFKSPEQCATSSIRFSPCNCDARQEETPPWMSAVTTTYLSQCRDQSAVARREGGRFVNATRAVWTLSQIKRT